MPQPKQILRLTEAATPDPQQAPVHPRSSPPPENPIPSVGAPIVPAGNLSRVVEQVQSRLAGLEKRNDAAHKKSAQPAESRSSRTSSTPEKLKARFREFREQEAALKVEKLALQSRLRAAEEEELQLRDKAIALQQQMNAVHAQTQKLRIEESLVAHRVEELRIAAGKLAKERQQVEQARHELEQLRQQLDRDQRAATARIPDLNTTSIQVDRRDTPDSRYLAAGGRCEAAFPVLSTASDVSSFPNTSSAPSAPATQSRLAAAFTFLALTAIAALAITVTWLTVQPIYRASATLASAVPFGSEPAAILSDPILLEALAHLRQRGLHPFDGTAAFANHLREHLTLAPGVFPGMSPTSFAGITPDANAVAEPVDAAAPASNTGNTAARIHQLTLTYESPLREQSVFVLDALTRAYAKAHAADAATVTHAAAADLFPLRDDRPRIAIIAFGVAAAALAIISLLLSRFTWGATHRPSSHP